MRSVAGRCEAPGYQVFVSTHLFRLLGEADVASFGAGPRMNVNETPYDGNSIIIAGVLGNGKESLAQVISSPLDGDKDVWNDFVSSRSMRHYPRAYNLQRLGFLVIR